MALITTKQVVVDVSYANNRTGAVAAGDNVTVALGKIVNSITTANGTGSGITWQSPKSSNFTAVSGNAYPINTSSANISVTLPLSPITGANIQIADYSGLANTKPITVIGNGANISGASNNVTMSTNRGALSLVYADSAQGWIPVVPVLPVPIVASSFGYLIVAGGGGNSFDNGGAGGGGVLQSLSQSLPVIGSYSVTIGSGGGANTNGSNTIALGLTAIGGGTGGTGTTHGASGGSGGGGGYLGGAGSAGSGTAGQGNNGGDGYLTHPGGGGGGGGGGGVGIAGTATSGGNGGVGFLSNITGVSTYYGGGGGGGQDGNTGTGGTGGAGGGGNGQLGSTIAATAGTANTGGGGGGGGGVYGSIVPIGGTGGSGIVILTYLTGTMVCTGGTMTTNGSYTVHTFTTSGTFTRTS